jgi:segregation and condensation protein A
VVKTDLFELITAYHQLINRTSNADGLRIVSEGVSVKDRMNEVIGMLEAKGTVTLLELIPHRPERMDIVVTFLAILEIVKLGLARLVQNGQNASLRLFYA